MATLQSCGTLAGHQRHVYYGQQPCAPCRAARNAYDQQRADDKRNAPKRRAVLAEAVGDGSYGGIAGGS